MVTNELISLILSIGAFIISIYATITARKNFRIERERTLRGQLSDVLGKLTELQLEFIKQEHAAKDDLKYFQSINSVFGQQNGFLLEQAEYISSRIPNLVSTYELNTIANSNAQSGNFLIADKNYRKAIELAPNNVVKALAIRSYGYFLFSQSQLNEGRAQFQKALDLLKGNDNFSVYQTGLTYQSWAICELNFARSQDRANEYFNKARNEFSLIDVEMAKNSAIESLNFIKNTQSSQPIMSDPSLQRGMGSITSPPTSDLGQSQGDKISS